MSEYLDIRQPRTSPKCHGAKLDIAIKALEAIAEHYTEDDPRIEKTNWNDWYEVFQNGSAVGMYLMGKDAREALKRLADAPGEK